MRRALKWSTLGVAGLLLLALVLVAGVALVLNTETGTRWAVDRATKFVPGDLEIAEFAGTLWQGLTVPKLNYRDADLEVSALDIELAIDWSHVPARRLMLSVLNAGSIEYRQLAPAPSEPQAFELAMAPLPVAIGLAHSRIGVITLTGNRDPIEIRDLVLEDARVEGNRLRVTTVSAAITAIAVSAANIRVELAGDVAASADVSWRQVQDEWSGRGALRGSLTRLQFEHTVAGPYPASASGTLELLHRTEPLVDAVVIPGRWSFGDYVMDGAELHVRGVADDYEATYDASLLLPGGQQLGVTGSATGNTAGLPTFAAQIQNPAGSAELSGAVVWAPVFAANARVHVIGFDPTIVVAALSGRLNADAIVALDHSGNVLINDITVDGVMRDAVIKARGNVALSARQLQCTDCRVAIGANQIRVDGTAGDNDIALSVVIDAQSLDQLWPGLAGAVAGRGQLGGTPSNPSFAGELQGQQLRFADWSAGSVALQSHATTLNTLDVTASFTQIARGDADLGSVTTRAKGQPDSLDLTVNWDLRGLAITAAGNVSRSEARVDGLMDRISVTEPNTGTWSLAESLAFHFDADGLNVESHRWSGAEGELRVTRVAATDEGFAFAASLVDLPLKVVNPFLPQTYALRGAASADLDVTQRDAAWTGTADLRLSDTVLTVLEAYDQSTDVLIPRADFNANLRDGGAQVAAALAIEPGVTAELDLQLMQLAADAPVVAEMRLRGDEWGWISAIVPAVDNLAGSIGASIRASGPLLSPEFSGDVTWREGQLVVPALNVPLDDIDLVVSGASDGAAVLAGSAKAGEGTLRFDGRFVDLMRSNRSVILDITGDTAELINWPEYHIWGSPDLDITGTRDGWTVNGQLGVPRADITFRELPVEAVAVSPDVIVTGDEQPRTPPTRYSGDVELVLGDRVRLQALGLDTRLSGRLLVRQLADRPLTAQGQIELLDGVFAAYGQKLTIRQGTLQFTGPLDDPIVDVRAVRIIETLDGTVTAGIHVRGRAQNLTSSVFAEPTMAEADALSYLVIGRPLSQATATEGGDLSGAAVSLGLKQATRLTEQIGQAVGLDQLSLTGDGGEATALVAGKQINPRVYARYTYGVFSRLGALLLHYKLSRRLSLEARTGEIQSLEIIYSVEKQ